MKLAVVIAGENAMKSAFAVQRGFEDSIRKASEYGYHGVELALKTADDVEPVKLTKWLDKSNMEVSCISTGQVFADLGLYFTHADPEVRKRIVEVFSGLINLAKDFGRLVNVGRSRGFIAKEQSPDEAENLFLETAGTICEIASKSNVEIMLEPVNRYEINFINNLDEGRILLSKLKYSNVSLMPDVFHMNIEDDKIGASLIRNAPYVRYIHFADSNRHAPGQGHLDFNEVFDALKVINFNGWASIEILPVPDPDTAAIQAAQYILPRIREYNKFMELK